MKKLCKKAISIIMTLLMILGLVAVNPQKAYAADVEPVWYMDCTTTDNAQAVVTIEGWDLQSTYGGNLTIDYNADLLTPSKYEFGACMTNFVKSCNLQYGTAGNQVRFSFSGAESLPEEATIITIYFDIVKEKAGYVEFYGSDANLYNQSGTQIWDKENGWIGTWATFVENKSSVDGIVYHDLCLEYSYPVERMEEEVWFEIKPEETGDYVIYSYQYYDGEGETNTYATLYDSDMNEIKSNDDSNDESFFSITSKLEEKNIYYLCTDAYDNSMGYYVGLSKIQDVEKIEVLSGKVVLTEKADGFWDYDDANNEFFRYEYGEMLYDLTLRITYGDGKSVEVQYSDRDIDVNCKIVSYDTQSTTPWTVGGNNYITLEYRGATVDVPVTIEEKHVKGISFSKEPSKVNYAFEELYCEDGEYYVFPSVEGMELLIEYTDGTTEVLSSNQMDMDHYLNGYYVSVPSIWVNQSSRYTATLTYMGYELAFEIVVSTSSGYTLSETAPCYIRDVDGEVQIEITFEEEGYYRIYSSNNTSETYMYAEIIGQGSTQGYDFSLSCYFEAGSVYYLSINSGCDSEEQISCDIYMKPIVEVASIEVISGEIVLNENQDGYWDGEFFYYDYAEALYNLELRIIYKDGNSEEVPFSRYINGIRIYDSDTQYDTPWMKEDENYITLQYFDAYTTVPVTIMEMQYQSFDVESPYQVSDSAETIWFEFVPEATGFYRFYSAGLSESGDTFAALYCGTAGGGAAQTNDDGGEGLNFSLTYPLEGGETYYLEVYSYDVASYSVYVEQVEAEHWNDNGTSHMQDIYGESWIEINPTETKYYQLNVATTSNCYMYADLYDQNMEYIDYAEGYILSTTAQLEAGETYYVIISGSETPFSCDVSMKQLPTVTGLELLEGEVGPLIEGIDSYAGVDMDYYFYELEDYDIMLRITYEDGSTKDMPYSRWINGIVVEDYHTQYDSPWTVGGEYYITLEYCGVSVDVPVVVVDNPVEKISFKNAPNYVGVLYEDEYDGDSSYNVEWGNLEGMEFLVEYKDGSSQTYSGEEFNEETYMLGDYQVFISTPNITGSGTYTATFEYMGHAIEFDAQVVESAISTVEVITEPNNITPMFHPDFLGMQIQITYVDGTNEVITVTEDNLYYYTGQEYYCIVKEGDLTIGIDPYYEYGDDWIVTKYWRVNVQGKSYVYKGIKWQTEKEIAELKASNVSLDALGMILNITYTDNSTEQIVVEPIYTSGGDETWSFGLVRTTVGVMRYDVTAYDMDNDGIIDEYIVEVDGEVVRVNASDGEQKCTHSKVEYVEAKEATEEKAGNYEYWYCPECQKYFSDEVCSIEKTLAELMIPVLGHVHKGIKTEAIAATCTEAGNKAYWSCSCGKIFMDEACIEEIALTDTVTLATGHSKEVIDSKAATCTEVGYTEGVKCSVCGEILSECTVIPAIAHSYDKGKVTKLATCDSTGILTYTCTSCKGIKTVVIAKIPKPGKTKISKVTGGKKKITIKFKKVAGIEGYQMRIATKKNMKKGVKSFIVKATKTKYVAKKLKAKTKYWVQICTYKTVNGEKVYSGWSNKKQVKTK